MSGHIWLGFAGGLVAFAHCLGMCGGFVLHLSNTESRGRMISLQLLWQGGRIFTYIFLGALAGYAGGTADLLLRHTHLQNILSYITGAVIILMGIALLGLLPVRGKEGFAGDGIIGSLVPRFLTAQSSGAALMFGITTGCLPCPVILAFLAYSLQSGSALNGMATMAGVGAGTMGPLLLLGFVSHLISARLRRWGGAVGGILLVGLGIVTILRGTPFFHHLLGCGHPPAGQQMMHQTMNPCCSGKNHGNGHGR